MENKDESKTKIEAIRIEQLFGYLTYELIPKENNEILILYGDNGSGKTTILNLVFHILAAEDSRGHKSYIAQVPFKKCTIDFQYGSKVFTYRKKSLEGPFTIEIYKKNELIDKYCFQTETDGDVKTQPKPKKYYRFLRTLAELNIGLFLIPDNRKIESNLYEGAVARKEALKLGEVIIKEGDNRYEYHFDSIVDSALKRAYIWSRKQALSASSQGETDTSKIYADIVKKIVSPKTSKNINKLTFSELMGKVDSLKERSEKFTKFGLTTPIDISEILPLLTKASSQKKGVVNQVISPYIRSFEAKLNALENLRESLETFTCIFNKFFNFKSLDFDIRYGINIRDKNDKELPPEYLSSGEKQLLLLFCNILLARSKPSIFIIDEPELSLNIKWQRELINSLIACVKDCDVQFIFATHSLEMLALHKNNAIRLEEIRN